MNSRPTVWLTRPQIDSQILADELDAHGVHSIIAPVLRVVTTSIESLPHMQPHALLVTSRHAAHALAELPAPWRQLPIYCVGGSTANVVSEVVSGSIIPAPDVLSLLPRIRADMKSGSEILYLAGQDVRLDVGPLLSPHGINVTKLIAYRAIEETAIPEPLTQALKQRRLRGALFFSPRSARLACTWLRKMGVEDAAATMQAFCMSLQVAQVAGALPWATMHVCPHPTRAAMLELVVSRLIKTV